MGYVIELVYFDDYISPNFALSQHKIDMNMFQHYVYMTDFKFTYDLAISAIAEIPTASMGIYSTKIDKITEVTMGSTIAIPDDSTNLARALMLLEDAQILKLNSFIDKSKATTADIVENPSNVNITLVEAHEIVNSLDDFDLSVINGNYALSAGLRLSDALYNEVLSVEYLNVIAVRTEDLSKQFVRDIISAIESENFSDVIIDPDGIYLNFQLPHGLV
jgi:D-methionine transport system substrate-binding protein